VANLAVNAVRHAPKGSAIEFAVGVVGIPHEDPQAAPDARRPEARRRGLPVPSFLRLPTPWGSKPAAEAPAADASEPTSPQDGPQDAAPPPRPPYAPPQASDGPHTAGGGPGDGPESVSGGDSAADDSAPTAGDGTEGTTASAAADAPPGDAPSQAIPAGPTHSNPFVTGPLELGEDLSGFPYGRVRFELRDHGEGIAPDQVPRIFERFYRLDSSRGRDTGGSGLGLSIVKAIVDSHSGTLSVHPTPSRGATFRVDMPVPGPDSVRRQATHAPSQATPRKDTP